MAIEFETTDIIEMKANGQLLYVTGVIHDDKRLFVTGKDMKEFEISFNDVEKRWAEKKL